MPELPEVESFRRYMEGTCLGRRVADVTIEGERTEASTAPEVASRLRGRTFTAAWRHGKWAFLEMDVGGYLLLHFGMTGRPVHSSTAPPHCRVRIAFDDGTSLYISDMRRFGRIGVVDSMSRFVAGKGLGPDALTVGSEEFVERMRRRGRAKAALMDQSVIAGVGNLYADETLFQAGVHPLQSLDFLGDGELERMRSMMASILEEGVRTKADLDSLPQDYLIHRRREGAECPRCGGWVRRMMVGGRGTYLCPRCQRLM